MSPKITSKITLIKLGGSVITNKEVPMMVRRQVLRRLILEIVAAQKKLNQKQLTKEIFILGHGGGSFPHVPALRYRVKSGFHNGESKMGMAITQDSAAQLNRIVVKECLNQNLPAVSFAFSNTLITHQKKSQHWDGTVLAEYLRLGLLPVTYGDVIADNQQGCTIWSTESIFSFLVDWLNGQAEYEVKRVVHVNEVAGVLDNAGQVVSEISPQDKAELKKMMTKTKGFDVTGGMWHKIEASLKLAKQGIETDIISGLIPQNLYATLTSQVHKGTHVSAQ